MDRFIKFSDDTKLGRLINTLVDENKIQNELAKLEIRSSLTDQTLIHKCKKKFI